MDSLSGQNISSSLDGGAASGGPIAAPVPQPRFAAESEFGAAIIDAIADGLSTSGFPPVGAYPLRIPQALPRRPIRRRHARRGRGEPAEAGGRLRDPRHTSRGVPAGARRPRSRCGGGWLTGGRPPYPCPGCPREGSPTRLTTSSLSGGRTKQARVVAADSAGASPGASVASTSGARPSGDNDHLALLGQGIVDSSASECLSREVHAALCERRRNREGVLLASWCRPIWPAVRSAAPRRSRRDPIPADKLLSASA